MTPRIEVWMRSEYNCFHCGESFYRYPSEVSGKRAYCSQRCKAANELTSGAPSNLQEHREWWQATYPEIPYGTCACGCGEETKISKRTYGTRNTIKGGPYIFVYGHNRRLSPVEYLVDPDTGCWLWQRAIDRKGYGVFATVERTFRAHRIVYERHKGPIPEGLELDHLCRNPPCVNPEHLEPVTHAENIRRAQPYR